METLDGTDWDIVISGTGFVQSLLALSLSRNGKRILHLDENAYYGGDEAAFSLAEAEEWAIKHSSGTPSRFSNASTTKPTLADNQSQLSPSRSYSLTLSPQLVYSRSKLIDAVVSSQIHNQLDFQAVGSFFVLNPRPASFSLTRLSRVPSGREDVFQDTQLDLRAKRALMKFLRFVSNYEEQNEVWQEEKQTPFPEFLEKKFGLPASSHAAILALTMEETAPNDTMTEFALPKIARHIRSIGVFGPGFGAVLPKWGGLAEIVQVACRACAVGGGVYVLGKRIKNFSKKEATDDGAKVDLELADGEQVTTKWLVGSTNDLPTETSMARADEMKTQRTSRSISIISSPLPTLFPQTSEGGPIPAGAVIVVPSPNPTEPAVHILAHTSEAGECPRNQCILYASVSLPTEEGFSRLEQAVKSLLESLPSPIDDSTDSNGRKIPQVLWRLQYQQTSPKTAESWIDAEKGLIILPLLAQDLVLEDSVLDEAKKAWMKVTAADEAEFMVFEAREGISMEDD